MNTFFQALTHHPRNQIQSLAAGTRAVQDESMGPAWPQIEPQTRLWKMSYIQWLQSWFRKVRAEILSTWNSTCDNLRKRVNWATPLVDIVESGHLDQPSNIIGKKFVSNDPFREFVPFVSRSTDRRECLIQRESCECRASTKEIGHGHVKLLTGHIWIVGIRHAGIYSAPNRSSPLLASKAKLRKSPVYILRSKEDVHRLGEVLTLGEFRKITSLDQIVCL